MSNLITYEEYLRQQVEKGCYGVAIVQAEVALQIADWVEKSRNWEDDIIRCGECKYSEDATDCPDSVWCKAMPLAQMGINDYCSNAELRSDE